MEYLRKRKSMLFGYLVFTGVYFGIFYLYGIPMDAPVYAGIITMTLFSLYMLVDILRYRRRLRWMKDLCSQKLLQRENFPKAEDQTEECYQELICRLEKEKEDLVSSVRISRQEMKDYYGMWVHQIKTPIAALWVLLQSEEPSIREMKQEIFKIEQYVELVLTYLRMEEMGKDLRIEKCSLDDLVKQAVRKYSKLFILQKIRLDYQPLEVEVLTDPKWLVFVIEQLLSNALKYTKEGQISIYWKEGCLVLEDTGIGIWPEDLPRVFERGFTGYNGRSHRKSTGIGLYLCKCILDQLSCPIWLESQVDQGTQVWIHLEKKEHRVE